MRKWLVPGALALIIAAAGCSGPLTGGLGNPFGRATEDASVDDPRFMTVVMPESPAGDAPTDAARQALAEELDDYVVQAVREFTRAARSDDDPPLQMGDAFARALAAETANRIVTDAEQYRPSARDDLPDEVAYRVPIGDIDARIVEILPKVWQQIRPLDLPPETAAERIEEFLGRRRLALLTEKEPEPEAVQPPPAADSHRTPEWLRRGLHPDFPKTGFLVSVGLAPTFDEARETGVKAMLNEATGLMKARLRGLESGGERPALIINAEYLPADGLRLQEADLAGVQIADRWYDPLTQTHYVMLASPRAETVARRLAVCRASANKARSLFGQAVNQRRALNYAAALADSFAALRAARDAIAHQCRALACTAPEGVPDVVAACQKPLLADCVGLVRDRLAELHIVKETGDGQWLPPGGSPPEALHVRAVFGEDRRPAPDVPLVADTTDQKPRRLASLVTDASGQAQLTVEGPLPSGVVVVRPDLAKLGRTDSRDGLRVPHATFTMVVRAPENMYFAVDIRGPEGDSATPADLQAAITDSLQKAGYNVIPEGKTRPYLAPLKVIKEPADEELLRIFGAVRQEMPKDGFLMVVTGVAGGRDTETIEADDGTGIIVSRCPYALRLLDPAAADNRREVLRLVGKGHGAHTGRPTESVNRARQDAAARASRELVERIQKTFGRPKKP